MVITKFFSFLNSLFSSDSIHRVAAPIEAAEPRAELIVSVLTVGLILCGIVLIFSYKKFGPVKDCMVGFLVGLIAAIVYFGMLGN